MSETDTQDIYYNIFGVRFIVFPHDFDRFICFYLLHLF